jgi:phosphoribosylamine--glycine ligase
VKVLVVGSGGREHAMARALSSDPAVQVTGAPGNPGFAHVTAAAVEAVAPDFDLVVVGPEAPLVAGLADRLSVPCCGPLASGARLEGSKAFCRQLAAAAGVPSPHFVVVRAAAETARALAQFSAPPVVKADGLAAGKGVFLPDTMAACAEQTHALLCGSLGDAGRVVVLEERLSGIEASLFLACHGVQAVALPHARDHKRLLDGDQGPNTGGMGAVSPNPDVDAALVEQVRQGFVLPVLERLGDYRGFLFVGIMLTREGPKLLEFNVRLGDPETQAILPRLPPGAFAELCMGAATGDLPRVAAVGDLPRVAAIGELPAVPSTGAPTCAIVLAAAGYPDAPRRGDPITLGDGLATDGRWFIHGSTRLEGNTLVTAGGRVAAVVAQGHDAVADAYAGVRLVQFAGQQVRRDIGLRRPQESR